MILGGCVSCTDMTVKSVGKLAACRFAALRKIALPVSSVRLMPSFQIPGSVNGWILTLPEMPFKAFPEIRGRNARLPRVEKCFPKG